MTRSEYTVMDGALVKGRVVDDSHRMYFRAEGVRQERTGIHARVTLVCNEAVLAWSNFNIEKDEDRVRLANSAYQHLNGLTAAYPKNYLKNDLDQFCAGLWEAQLGQLMPEELPGSLVAQPPAFLLYPFVLNEGGTIIFAPPGRGKSYTLMLMAVSIDAGLDNLWCPVKQSKVLFINLERGATSVQARLGNINSALGLPRGRQLGTMNARGKSLSDVAESAKKYINQHDVGVVFVDSISRAGAGDLTANEDVNRICDILNGLGPAWVGLAHTPRNDESHLYGSVHFEAAADAVVRLLSQQDEDGPLGIGLQITKQNDIGRVPMWTMALEFSELGLTTVRPARPSEFMELEANKPRTNREKVIDQLREIGQATATQVAEELGLDRANVANILRKDEAFVLVKKSGEGAFYGLKAVV